METECEAVAPAAVSTSADHGAAVAREAAVALNEQASTEMETECEAVAAVSGDEAVVRGTTVARAQ